ncbi:hypothetical protein ACH5RR_012089 [Cinchona calisaya]|uniref:B box-type domain-containing protein n=1 Tax=Cinchona calisaya TaxID=153742 RepID=A0ABD3ACM7_9GENT
MQNPIQITSFLQKTFFVPCSNHEEKKNDLNFYCTDCDLAICKNCISTSHKHHNFIQIFKYSYKDSVRVEDIKEYIDCSEIQTYRCNRQKVFVLNRLPSSGSRTDEDNCCIICHRKLIDSKQFSYCSIGCKIEAYSRESDNLESRFHALEAPAPLVENCKRLKRSGSGRRKGVPTRAPTN